MGQKAAEGVTHTTRTAHELAAALGLPLEAGERWLHDARADERRERAAMRRASIERYPTINAALHRSELQEKKL